MNRILVLMSTLLIVGGARVDAQYDRNLLARTLPVVRSEAARYVGKLLMTKAIYVHAGPLGSQGPESVEALNSAFGHRASFAPIDAASLACGEMRSNSAVNKCRTTGDGLWVRIVAVTTTSESVVVHVVLQANLQREWGQSLNVVFPKQGNVLGAPRAVSKFVT